MLPAGAEAGSLCDNGASPAFSAKPAEQPSPTSQKRSAPDESNSDPPKRRPRRSSSSSKGKKRSAPDESSSTPPELDQTNSTPGQVKAFCCFSYVMALVHSFTCVSLLLLLPTCQTFFTERIVERLPRKLLKNLLLQTQTTKNRSPRRRRIK